MFSSKFDFHLSAGRQLEADICTNGPSCMKALPLTSSHVLVFHSLATWKAHFEASKATNKLMVIEFTASWCATCRFIDPAINEFAAKYADVEFIKIDADELMGAASEFEVQTLPTLVLIKKGIVVDTVTGVKKEELQNKIEKHRAFDYYYHH